MKGVLCSDEHFIRNNLGVPRRFQGNVIEEFCRPSIFKRMDHTTSRCWSCQPHFNARGAD
jgi:hypothetical protein